MEKITKGKERLKDSGLLFLEKKKAFDSVPVLEGQLQRGSLHKKPHREDKG